VGGAGNDHFQTRRVQKQRLQAVGMQLRRLYSAAEGGANHQRHVEPSAGPEPETGGLGADLIHRLVNETLKLNFRHGTKAEGGQGDGRSDDARFGQGRVKDALFPELLVKALRRPEHAAVDSDVFPQDPHGFIPFHLRSHAILDRFDHRHDGHYLVSPFHFRNSSFCAFRSGVISVYTSSNTSTTAPLGMASTFLIPSLISSSISCSVRSSSWSDHKPFFSRNRRKRFRGSRFSFHSSSSRFSR